MTGRRHYHCWKWPPRLEKSEKGLYKSRAVNIKGQDEVAIVAETWVRTMYFERSGYVHSLLLMLLLCCFENNAATAWIEHGMPFARKRSDDGIHSILFSRKQQEEAVKTPSFYVREAREEDLAKASTVVTEAFFRDKTNNFFTTGVRRFQTFSSLSSKYQTFKYSERSSGERARHRMLVVVSTDDGEESQGVVGFCEVDDVIPKGEINPAPRPYLSNLAIADEFQRRGLARMLLEQGESIVRDGWGQSQLHLNTEEDNVAASNMYESCGYSLISTSKNMQGETILLFRKSLTQ